MKRINLIVYLTIITILWAKGQAILTPNDFPYAGLSLEIYEAKFDSLFISDTSIFKIGNVGANSEYDFSQIESYITDTIKIHFIPADSTPFASFHANADLAIIEDSAKLYKYYSIDSNSFTYIGYSTVTEADSNTIDTIHFSFSGSELLMSTDFSYNYQYNGYYGYGTQYDSITGMSVLTNDTIKIDSYGSLITSMDTFQVLRAHIISNSHHTYYQLPYQIDFFTHKEQYKYFTNNIGYPIVAVTLDCEYQRILNIQYVNTGQAIQNLSKIPQSIEFNIYPNPNNGNFIIKFINIEKNDIKLEITNVLGQTVYYEELNISGVADFNKKISLKDAHKGLFFVKITFNQRQIIKKIIIY